MSELGTLLRERYEHLAGRPIDVERLIERLVAEEERAPARLTETLPRRRRLPVLIGAAATALALVVLAWLGWQAFADPDQVVDEPIPSTTTVAPPTTVSGRGGLTVIDLETEGPMYTGHFVTIDLRPDGLPILTYLVDLGNEDFAYKVVSCREPGCTGDVDEVILDITEWGQDGAVAIGPDGLTTFVYLDNIDNSGDQRVKVATCGDLSCSEIVVNEIGVGQGPAVVIPADGLPLITFGEFDTGDLVAVKCADRTCSAIGSTAVLPAEQWSTGQLVVGADGLPMLAYDRLDLDLGARVLTIIRCETAGCASSSTVDIVLPSSPGAETFVAAVAVGSDGLPTFAVSEEAYQLMMVRCSDPACDAVDRAMLVGPRQVRGETVRLAIPADGLPVIAYPTEGGERTSEEITPALKVAKCADAACTSGTIATIAEGRNMWSADLTLGPDGPVVAFYDPPSRVGVVVCTDPGCISGAISVETWDQTVEAEPLPVLGPIMEGWVGIVVEGLPGRFGGGLGGVAVGPNGRIVATGTASRQEDGFGSVGVVVVADEPLDWFAHDLSGIGELGPIVAGGPGFVAGGSTCPLDAPDPECAPGIWTSVDGVVWEGPVSPEAFTPMGDCEFCQMRLDSLSTDGSSFFAIGVDGAGTGLWRSADGLAWERADLGFLPEGDAWLDDVIPVPSGFLAIGGSGTPVLDDEGDWIDYTIDALLFISDDGSTWDQVAMPTPAAYSTFLTAVTPWDRGIFMMVEVCDEEYECRRLAFNSGDGLAWDPVGLPGELFDGAGDYRIVGVGSSLMVVGATHDELLGLEQGFFIVTSDLEVWERFAADPDLFPQGVPINDIIALDDGTLIAVGTGSGLGSTLSGIYVLPAG